MTAIYGVWRFDGAGVAADFQRMGSALSRYGGDDEQAWSGEAGLAIGRQLHISLPEDRFVAPLAPGQRYVVAADVRLTERDDLVRQLGLGHEAGRMSDAALAAAAVEAWHEQAFERIYGAFAIAAWDTRHRRLLLARDHLGHKPLFFHSGESVFAFASMPAGLHAIPAVPRGPDVGSINRFLALENLSPGKTYYAAIGRVMPGHFAVVEPGGVTQTRYWTPDVTPLQLGSHEEYAEAFAERLDSAVAAALRGAGTEVGAHLSSGFDTTAVATSAAVQLAKSGGRVVAYTAAPRDGYDATIPDRLADESGLAAATAALHFNMQHVVIRSDRTPISNLARTSSIYAVPVLNICNQTWVDAINEDAAARGIKVMLEASMGNATISESGILALPELVRAGRLLSWLRLAFHIRRQRRTSWQAILWNSFNPLLPNRIYKWLVERRYGALVTPSSFSPLKEEKFRNTAREAARESAVAIPDNTVLSTGWSRPTASSVADRLLMLDSDDYGAFWKGILGEWKIDYRDPTADRRLAEFSLRIPVEQLIHGGEERALLRKALAGRAPSEVLNNERKGYQFADWHEWLGRARADVLDEIDRIERFEPAAEIMDVARLNSLVARWPEPGSHKWTDYETIAEYRCCLLRAISAAKFMREASGSNY